MPLNTEILAINSVIRLDVSASKWKEYDWGCMVRYKVRCFERA